MESAMNALIAKYNEQKSQARQHENLRTSVVNFTMATAGGVLAFSGGKDTVYEFRLISALFIYVLGLSGAVLAWKHYERFRYHQVFAHALDRKIESLARIAKISDFAALKTDHERAYGWIGLRRSYLLWILAPLVTALLGALLFAALWYRHHPVLTIVVSTALVVPLIVVYVEACAPRRAKEAGTSPPAAAPSAIG